MWKFINKKDKEQDLLKSISFNGNGVTEFDEDFINKWYPKVMESIAVYENRKEPYVVPLDNSRDYVIKGAIVPSFNSVLTMLSKSFILDKSPVNDLRYRLETGSESGNQTLKENADKICQSDNKSCKTSREKGRWIYGITRAAKDLFYVSIYRIGLSKTLDSGSFVMQNGFGFGNTPFHFIDGFMSEYEDVINNWGDSIVESKDWNNIEFKDESLDGAKEITKNLKNIWEVNDSWMPEDISENEFSRICRYASVPENISRIKTLKILSNQNSELQNISAFTISGDADLDDKINIQRAIAMLILRKKKII